MVASSLFYHDLQKFVLEDVLVFPVAVVAIPLCCGGDDLLKDGLLVVLLIQCSAVMQCSDVVFFFAEAVAVEESQCNDAFLGEEIFFLENLNNARAPHMDDYCAALQQVTIVPG